MNCAVCPTMLKPGASTRYQIGGVDGRLCPQCQLGIDAAIARWMSARMKELEKERRRLDDEAFRQRLADQRLARRALVERRRELKSLRDDMFPEFRSRAVRVRQEAAE